MEEEAERRRLQRQKERLDTLRKWADRLAKTDVDLTEPLAICDAPTEVLTEAAEDPHWTHACPGSGTGATGA